MVSQHSPPAWSFSASVMSCDEKTGMDVLDLSYRTRCLDFSDEGARGMNVRPDTESCYMLKWFSAWASFSLIAAVLLSQTAVWLSFDMNALGVHRMRCS